MRPDLDAIEQAIKGRDLYGNGNLLRDFWWSELDVEQIDDLLAYTRELEGEIAQAKALILRGWDDHMFSFETMDERDEGWLLTWAGHPTGPVHAAHHGEVER